eukprot:CAMPEP_0172605350 /NCGR_PEP_ID=MMETSP1068-20121228/25591_1 /TAXON_ID=35684 /ORGANISM="Pseudopedinella elastica, Strain CCMP716" /LENGTH=418 /DNA_ID=CAMNT_0013407727 /DNA_START=310 /DNA_END=1566 /DNA_ORIENTATION=+
MVLGFETIGNETYLDRVVEVYKAYRFVICFENSRIGGYVTEKIVSAFLAGSIPIYLGAPDIEAHFNPASFVNCHGTTLAECAELVKRIDTNETLYQAMRSQSAIQKGDTLGGGYDWYPEMDATRNLSMVATYLSTLIPRFRSTFLLEGPGSSESSPLLRLPDVTIMARPRSKTLFQPFFNALNACPVFPVPVFADFIQATCQITAPRRLKGFISCEPIRYKSFGSYDSAAFDFESARTVGHLVPFPSELLSESGTSENGAVFALALQDPRIGQSNLGGVVMARGSDPDPSLVYQVRPDGHESTLKMPIPAVTVSKVDWAWIGHEITQCGNTTSDRNGPLKFEILFKLETQTFVDTILEVAEEKSQAGDGSGSLTCIQQAVVLSPYSKKVARKASESLLKEGLLEEAKTFRGRSNRLAL